MKLRNKKTGYVVEAELWLKRKCCNEEYISLQGLNEIWEDYKPTEPLIKDEKIRKAVRAWAEACGFARLCFDEYHNALRNIDDRAFTTISFARDVDENTLPLEDNKTYTIAELCGEEEECES